MRSATACAAAGTSDVIGILVFLVARHKCNIVCGAGRYRVDEFAADLLPGPEANTFFYRAEKSHLILNRKAGRILRIVDAAHRVIGNAIANRLPNRSEGHIAVAFRRDTVDCDAGRRTLFPPDKGVARTGRRRQRNRRILNGIGGRKIRKPLNRTVSGLIGFKMYAVMIDRPSGGEMQVACGSLRDARDRLAV